MKTGRFSLSQILILILVISFSPLSTYSQCTNTTPIGENQQTFCINTNPTISDIVVSGENIAWYDSPTEGTKLDSNTILVKGKKYYADNISDNNCSAIRLEVLVNIIGNLPLFVDVFVGKCSSENPTIASLSAEGENIQWFEMQYGGNPLPENLLLQTGTTYWVQQTENGCTSDRLPTTVTLVDPPAPVVDLIQSFCSDSNPTINDLFAAGLNINWYISEDDLTPLPNTQLLENGKTYWASQNTFPCESVQRSSTTVFINTAPNAGTSSSLILCNETLIPTNLFDLLGGNPDKNGTWTGPSELSGGYLGTFIPDLNILGTYTYTVDNSSSICANSNATISITTSNSTPPTTSEETQTFCVLENATIANLIADGNNIKWYDTETSTTPLSVEEILINGEDYWASQTSDSDGCESADRLKIIASFIQQTPPTTSEETQTFCVLENATIANLIADGNNIKWYDTETSTTPLSVEEILINGEDYWASQTSNSDDCESTDRLKIIASFFQQAPPTTSEETQTFCVLENATIANLIADGNNIKWYDTKTSTTPLSVEEILINGEDYWASQTSDSDGCESANRLKIIASFIQQTPPTTSEETQTFCILENATIANLIADGNNIKWYDTETSTTPLSVEEILINGEDYWASQTSDSDGCESANRLKIIASFIQQTPPTTSEETQTFCILENATIANLIADGNNIKWYDTETSTTPLSVEEILINGEDYWASQTSDSDGCESANRLKIIASFIQQTPPTTSEETQTFCVLENATIANLIANGNNIKWYDTETSTTPLSVEEILINGEDYWASQTSDSDGCESADRLKIIASFIQQAPPTTSEETQTFCVLENATIANLIADGNNIKWYDTKTSTTPLSVEEILINGEDYWASQTSDSDGCESVERLSILAIIITPTTPIQEINSEEFCKSSNLSLYELSESINANSTSDLVWYDSFPRGNKLELNTSLDSNKIYYALTNTTNCEEIIVFAVTVNLIDCDDPEIEIYDGFSPNGDGINDEFVILNLRALFPNFRVDFFNKWGKLIYTATAKNLDWNGNYNGDGAPAPAGMYYFIINFNKDNKEPIQNRLYLSR